MYGTIVNRLDTADTGTIRHQPARQPRERGVIDGGDSQRIVRWEGLPCVDGIKAAGLTLPAMTGMGQPAPPNQSYRVICPTECQRLVPLHSCQTRCPAGRPRPE